MILVAQSRGTSIYTKVPGMTPEEETAMKESAVEYAKEVSISSSSSAEDEQTETRSNGVES
jgi:hypothetical protein